MSDTQNCPYCNAVCDADFCDVDVGMIQCGPYHCQQCGASEIGPYDNYVDPYKPYRFPDDQPEEPKSDPRVLELQESKTGWYQPHSVPGSSANVIGGKVVSHQVMKATYHQEFHMNPLWNDKSYVDKWWEDVRKEKS